MNVCKDKFEINKMRNLLDFLWFFIRDFVIIGVVYFIKVCSFFFIYLMECFKDLLFKIWKLVIKSLIIIFIIIYKKRYMFVKLKCIILIGNLILKFIR